MTNNESIAKEVEKIRAKMAALREALKDYPPKSMTFQDVSFELANLADRVLYLNQQAKKEK